MRRELASHQKPKSIVLDSILYGSGRAKLITFVAETSCDVFQPMASRRIATLVVSMLLRAAVLWQSIWAVLVCHPCNSLGHREILVAKPGEIGQLGTNVQRLALANRRANPSWQFGARVLTCVAITFATATCRSPSKSTPQAALSNPTTGYGVLALSSAGSSASNLPNSESAPTVDPCQAWGLHKDHEAIASLETFCQRFGPCPGGIAEAGAKEPYGSPPMVTATARGIWLTYGRAEGWQYAFDRQGVLLGAMVWRESPFGDCGERATRYTGGPMPEVEEDESVDRCGFVPGRDLTQQKACSCARPRDRPIRIGLDSGPTLTYTLDCLYEFGIIGDFCQRTADRHAETAQLAPIGVGDGCLLLPDKSIGTDCVYDKKGSLIEVRIGKRFTTPGFATACRRQRVR